MLFFLLPLSNETEEYRKTYTYRIFAGMSYTISIELQLGHRVDQSRMLIFLALGDSFTDLNVWMNSLPW